MKTITSIPRPALLGLFALTLGTSTPAQEPAPATAPVAPADIENSDPFLKNPSTVAEEVSPPLTADQLDAQARVLFDHDETEKAIALQLRAVEVAKQTLTRCTQNLARYQGKPADLDPIEKKMRSIIIPRIEFEDTPIEEAVEFLRMRTRELDPEPDSNFKGINFVILTASKNPNDPFEAEPAHPEGEKSPLVRNLSLRNLSAADVLKHVCLASGTTYRIENGAVIIQCR